MVTQAERAASSAQARARKTAQRERSRKIIAERRRKSGVAPEKGTIQVKTPSGFVRVPSGTDVTGAGRGTSRTVKAAAQKLREDVKKASQEVKIIETKKPKTFQELLKSSRVEASKFSKLISQQPKTFQELVSRGGSVGIGEKKRNEIFSRELNAFIRQSEPSGQATAIIRLPTLKEKIDIESAEYAGSFQRLKDESKKALKAYERKVVIPLSKSKPFKFYEKKVVVPLSEKGVEPTRKAIKGTLKAYQENVVVPLRKALPSLGETQIGQIAQAKRLIESKKPGEIVRIGLPGQIREIEVSKFQGKGLIEFAKEVYGGEVEATFTDISKKAGASKKTAGYIGKGVSIGSELAAYTIPGVFTAEVASKIAEAELTEGAFGGSKSAVEFTVEHPLEVGLAAAIGVLELKGLLKGKAGLRKLGQVSKRPISKEIILREKLRKVDETRKILARQTKVRSAEGLRTLKSTPKVKGKIRIRAEIPTGEFKGTVRETIRTGLLERPKTFTGKVTLTKSGKYTEVVELGRGLKKVTTVSKDGKTTIALIKNGKKIAEREADKLLSSSLKLKKEVFKKSAKTQLGKGGSRVELKGYDIFGKRIKQVKTTGELRGGLVARKAKIVVRHGIDPKTGLSKRIKTADDIIDITKIGPREGILSVKTRSGNILVKKSIGQKVKFAKAKVKVETDISHLFKEGRFRELKKIQSPKIQRTILAKSRQEIQIKFTDPKYAEKVKKLFDFKAEEKIFYHGTKTKNIGKILREGIKKGNIRGEVSRKGTVFLTSDKKMALKFASDKKSLLKVKLTKGQYAKAEKFGIKRLKGRKGEIIGLSKTISPKQIQLVKPQVPKLLTQKKVLAKFKKSTTVARKAKEGKLIMSRVTEAHAKANQKLLLLEKQRAKLASKLRVKTKTFIEPTRSLVKKVRFKTPQVPVVLGVKAAPRLASSLIPLTATGIVEISKLAQPQAQKPRQINMTTSGQDLASFQDVGPAQKIKQEPIPPPPIPKPPKPEQITEPVVIPDIITPIVRPSISIVTKVPVLSDDIIPKLKVKTKKVKARLTPKKQFHMPQAKRNDKWVNLASTGLLKRSARGRGARVADNTVAVAFRTRPVNKGNPKIIDNYFAFNRKKFRDYKIVKGKKVPVVDKFFERRGVARIDSAGEKAGLTISKFLKRKGWAGKKKTKASKVMKSKLDVPKNIANALRGKI